MKAAFIKLNKFYKTYDTQLPIALIISILKILTHSINSICVVY